MAADFDKQSYWHSRFASETSFEWLLPSDRFMDLIDAHLAHLGPESRVLQLGSGTSNLQNHFRARGIVDVTNLDYEPLAADRGRDLERRAFGDVRMSYAVDDATQMRDSDRPYDLIVDKSTCDAVACGGDEPLRRMANAIRRSLRPGAVWIALSFSSTRFAIPNLPFDVDVIAKVPTPKLKPTDPDIYHWCYLLRPT